MIEQPDAESWYEPTGLAGLAHAPDRLTWYLIAEHLAELSWCLGDLQLSKADRKRVMRLATVHAHELAVLHGCPPPESMLAASEARRAAQAAEQGGSYEPGEQAADADESA